MFKRIFWPIVVLLAVLTVLTSPPVLSKFPAAKTETPTPTRQPAPTPTASATPDPFSAVPTITPIGGDGRFIQPLPASEISDLMFP